MKSKPNADGRTEVERYITQLYFMPETMDNMSPRDLRDEFKVRHIRDTMKPRRQWKDFLRPEEKK